MNPKASLFIEKALFLKQGGYALIAVGLIFLMFLGTIPELHVPWLLAGGYLLIAIGGISVVLYKCMEIIQYSHLRKRTALCQGCGWFGQGDQWYRSGSCPQCDSDNIFLH